MDLYPSRLHILRCWAGTPDQHRQTKRLPLNAKQGGTARALPQQWGMVSSAGLRLCSPRRLAPSLPQHGAS